MDNMTRGYTLIEKERERETLQPGFTGRHCTLKRGMKKKENGAA